jgi:hypothetical protein
MSGPDPACQLAAAIFTAVRAEDQAMVKALIEEASAQVVAYAFITLAAAFVQSYRVFAFATEIDAEMLLDEASEGLGIQMAQEWTPPP